jgi:hypothetical protein
MILASDAILRKAFPEEEAEAAHPVPAVEPAP